MRRTALLALLLTACAGPGSLPPAPRPASVRVSFDARGLTSARAWGLADRTTGRRVTADDPVRIASISKLVTAIAVMRLVEAGRLDLDRDVSAYLGFPVRNPAYRDVPITLRLLLSHRSSLTDGADYVLPLDTTIRATLSDARAWDAAHPPGRFFRYTNLNFGVIASVMEAATGERFDRLMTDQLFAPLKIDACFNWSGCSDAAVARAVVLYGADGAVLRDDLHGVRPACPVVSTRDGACDLATWRAGANGASFSPQGGVRISMRDLAQIGRLLMEGGTIDGLRLLSPASVSTLKQVEWAYDGANGDPDHGFYCAYGLGMMLLGTQGDDCLDDPFGDGHLRFGHAGDAYGVRSGLWIDPKTRTGVAYFTTAVAPDAPRGRSAFTVAEERMAQGRR